MRSLFSGGGSSAVTPTAGPASGGWNGLSGKTKLGIGGGIAIAAMTAVMWPGMNSKPANNTAPQPDHPPARISDYEPPPPVQDVAARVMDDKPPPQRQWRRPIPTEMSLYTVKPSPIAVAQQAAPVTQPAPAEQPASGLPPTNRAVLVRNPDYLIRAGDVIPCLPIPHQNSEKPGFETCQVPVWFRSSNQRRGLLPPHTRLFGQMREGMQAGERRLGIVYSLIETPYFDVPIASPAGDPLGAAGLDKVNVETFFWDRAGAVALYALMDMAVGVGQNAAQQALSKSFSNGGTSVNIQGPAQSLAAREFDATINRPPVGTRSQALPVTVIVGQNLDLYDACMQAMRVDPMACPRQ